MSGAESLSFGGQFRISLPRVGPASARRPAPSSRVASFLFAEESPAAPPAPAVGAPRRSERPGRRPPARASAARGVAARLDFDGAADEAATASPRAAAASAWAGAQTPRAEARTTPRAETVRVPSRGEEPRFDWSPAVGAASPEFDDDAPVKRRPVPDPAAFGDAAAVSAAAEAGAHARATGAVADARARRSAPRAAPPPRVASSLDATKVLVDAALDAHDRPAWVRAAAAAADDAAACLLYTSPSPRDKRQSRMPSSA